MPFQDELCFALRLADLADEMSLPRFNDRRFDVRLKADGSPVTDVDVAVEKALLASVQAKYPDDAFLGEEVGEVGEVTSRRRWIVDGIDGTVSFSAGGRSWATLIALQEGDDVLVGVITSPALRTRWWAASGAGAWCARGSVPTSAPRALRVLDVPPGGSPAVSVMPPAGVLGGWRDAAVRAATGRFQDASGRGHGPLLVAEARAAASVHLWGGPWDHAAFVVLVEEAGGRFSDLWGGRRIDTGTAVFSNSFVHDEVRHVACAESPLDPESRQL